jgi:hypothetical protein
LEGLVLIGFAVLVYFFYPKKDHSSPQNTPDEAVRQETAEKAPEAEPLKETSPPLTAREDALRHLEQVNRVEIQNITVKDSRVYGDIFLDGKKLHRVELILETPVAKEPENQ